MVVFCCSSCGDSLKKNQVEKHFQKCRKCKMISCIDCGEEFWGNEYKEHIKCISEKEKYSGKNYKPKENANKGEAKQGEWLQQIRHAVDECPESSPLRKHLVKLMDYPNIPRKHDKFQNFLQNCLKFKDVTVIQEVWELVIAARKDSKNNDPASTTQGCDVQESSGNDKKEQKDEVQKKADKVEKKDKSFNEENKDGLQKKRKRKKHVEVVEQQQQRPKGKKRKNVEESKGSC